MDAMNVLMTMLYSIMISNAIERRTALKLMKHKSVYSVEMVTI